jgi:hypothetical protein
MRSVVGGRKISQINLRKGEFAYIQNYEQIARVGKVVAKVLGLALVLLLLSYGFRSFLYNRQIANLEKEFLKEYNSIPVASKKKIAANTSFLKARADAKAFLQKEVSARRSAVELFIASSSTSPSLLALNDLSAGIPRGTKIDITQFAYSAQPLSSVGKLVLKGEADGYSSVEAIKEAIKKIATFSNLEEKQSGGKPGTDNKIIEFTFNATYTPATQLGKKG